MLLPADFYIRIHKVVERRSLLCGCKSQIAALGKLHPIGIVGAEKVIVLFGMLPGL